MLNYIKSISIFLILQLGICFCADLSAVDILEKSIRRLDGVDHSLFIDATTKPGAVDLPPIVHSRFGMSCPRIKHDNTGSRCHP